MPRMFNTLKYAKMLEQVGFSRDQSETTIGILTEVMDEKLATKQDLRELESKLTIKMGTMLAATVALIVGLLKVL